LKQAASPTLIAVSAKRENAKFVLSILPPKRNVLLTNFLFQGSHGHEKAVIFHGADSAGNGSADVTAAYNRIKQVAFLRRILFLNGSDLNTDLFLRTEPLRTLNIRPKICSKTAFGPIRCLDRTDAQT
jgi:hypothetical protein